MILGGASDVREIRAIDIGLPTAHRAEERIEKSRLLEANAEVPQKVTVLLIFVEKMKN